MYLIKEDPKSYKEATESINANFGKKVRNSELESLIANGTWTLTNIPEGSKTLRSKWVFKIKLRADGTIDKFKARLVVQGFNQKGYRLLSYLLLCN